MKKVLLLLLVWAINFVANANTAGPSLSLAFVENKGQVKDQNGAVNQNILYLFTSGGFKVHLTPNGFSYELVDIYQKSKISSHRVDILFKGASNQSQIIGLDKKPGNLFYRNSGDINQEIVAHVYGGVLYKNVYPGIDVEFLVTADKRFKYNFIVHPGADANLIQLEVNGAKNLKVNKKGAIEIATSKGVLEENVPLSYELGLNQKQGKTILAGFKQLSKNVFGIQTGNYNKNLSLVIDPIVWSTYFGGSGTDQAGDVLVDASNNIYITGRTSSDNAIATVGAHQSAFVGAFDAFVAKFSPTGTLLWATYLGGLGSDEMSDAAIDANQNIWITAYTTTTTGMATAGAFQTSISTGGGGDALLVKFSSTGSLLYSTYFGGSGTDEFKGINIEPDGDINVVGSSSSPSFPLVFSGVHRTTMSGQTDAIIIHFSSNGIPEWGTYYGGTLNDYSYDVESDGLGNIYVAGNTFSDTGFSTTNGFKKVNDKNVSDAFIGKFDSTGNIIWGTFYGGSSSDVILKFDLDTEGKLVLIGYSSSTANVATSGAYQTAISGLGYDAMILKMDTSGVPIWCTYYGGSGTEYLYDVTTDPFGNIYAMGSTTSSSNIATVGSPQTVFGGIFDAFTIVFDKNGNRISGTYLGAGSDDQGRSIQLDGVGNLYLYGQTSSSLYFGTPGSHQPARGGTVDTYLTKFFLGVSGPITNNLLPLGQNICGAGSVLVNDIIGGTPGGGNGTFTFYWIYSPSGATGSWVPATGTNNTANYSPGILSANAYYRRIVLSDIYFDSSNVYAITFGSKPKAVIGVNKAIQCVGNNNFVFSNLTVGAGTISSEWDFGNGVKSTNNVDSLIYAPSVDNMFVVRLISQLDGGCADTAFRNVFLIGKPAIKTVTGNILPRPGITENYTVPSTNGSTYKWVFESGVAVGTTFTNTIKIKWTSEDTVDLKVVETNGGGCVGDTNYLQVVIHDPTGTEEFNLKNLLTVYPNPTNGLVYLNYTGMGVLNIELRDMQGRLIYTGANENNTLISLQANTSGIYFLFVKDEQGNTAIHRIELIK
jgi:hypothetical protein